MKERPILFSAPMVRAILDGSKTQTRRVVKPPHNSRTGEIIDCPYGRPGDQLWVRERFRDLDCGEIDYHADGREVWGRMQDYIALSYAAKWKPSIHMPRWASRITLEISGVGVEQLGKISEEDAHNEGIKLRFDPETKSPLLRLTGKCPPSHGLAVAEFASLWESINGPGSWAANPWVWVIEFKRVKP